MLHHIVVDFASNLKKYALFNSNKSQIAVTTIITIVSSIGYTLTDDDYFAQGLLGARAEKKMSFSNKSFFQKKVSHCKLANFYFPSQMYAICSTQAHVACVILAHEASHIDFFKSTCTKQ